MIPLKSYQEAAVIDLTTKCLHELRLPGKKSVVFEAPTGSGKTVMMQAVLKRIAEAPSAKERCFIWISIGSLANQSRLSFEKNAPDAGLRYLELEDIQNGQLSRGEVLFLNWEKLKSKDKKTGDWKVLAMKDNEHDANIPNYLRATHDAGREVILIMDESDVGTDSFKAQEIIDIFKPKLQIEVSATPDSKNPDARARVSFESVVEAGMLKTEIAVNLGLTDFADTDTDTDHAVLDAALAKRAEIAEEFARQGVSVNPLLCIQLPSEAKAVSDLDTKKIDRVKQFLSVRGISEENKKLAIWLSDEKKNLDAEIPGQGIIKIENPVSPVEVLIFKMAVARGWDCPRAHILVMFRDIGSVTFQKQTLGRILRTPEQKHYLSDLLDKGYVYTDLPRMKIGVQEEDKGYIITKWTKKRSGVVCPKLPSTYMSRADYNDIGSSFYEVVEKVLAKETWAILPNAVQKLNDLQLEENRKKLGKLIDISDKPLSDSLLADGKILVAIDEIGGDEIYSDIHVETCSQYELAQMQFDAFCRKNVRPEFGNIARSYPIIKGALFSSLRLLFFWEKITESQIHAIVLRNREFFEKNILETARREYRPIRDTEVVERKKREAKRQDFSLPEMESYDGKISALSFQKYAYEPACFGFASEGEKVFSSILESWKCVKWWWKNKDNGQSGLGIPYTWKDRKPHTFYPDFIVCFQDWTLGIFDTKFWNTLEDGRERLAGLIEWLWGVNNEEIRAWGGLVVAQDVWGEKTAMFTDNPNFENWNNSRKDFSLMTEVMIEKFDTKKYKNIKKSTKPDHSKLLASLQAELEEKEKERVDFCKAQMDAAEFDNEKLEEIDSTIHEIKEKIKKLQ